MYKSLFLSDFHLGARWNNSQKLFQLLENIEAEQLFLVGDIVNITASKEHPEVLRFIELIQRKPWKIIYISGNHEDERGKRPPISLSLTEAFFSQDNYIYNNGQECIYLEHGHHFHQKNQFNKFLRKGLLFIRPLVFRREESRVVEENKSESTKEGFYYRFLKPLAQKLLRHSFKSYMYLSAKEKGCTVVVCGHFHIPEDSMIGKIRYLNCGDWVKNSSCIVENQDGEFSLLQIS